MPRIARLGEIAIWMYYRPQRQSERACFHACRDGDEAIVDIERAAIIAGGLRPHEELLVLEWAIVHRRALRENWARAVRQQPLHSLDRPSR
jgi:Domain of unknown function (DUF4160)